MLARVHYLLGDRRRVEPPDLAREHDRATLVVVTIGIELADDGIPQLARQAVEARLRHAVQRKRRLDDLQRLDQGTGQDFVACHVHVERAVRLDVLQRDTGQPSELAQRADLVQHLVDEFGGRCIEVAAPEAHRIPKARVRTDADTVRLRAFHGPPHDVRVARMKSRGDIGRADQRHQLLVDVVTDLPRAEALTEVGVQVNASLHARHLLFRCSAD